VDEPRYYMACLDLSGRRCVVVGGGRVGLEKSRGLLECGASVTVVAPEVTCELRDEPVEWVGERYASRHARGAWLLVAATPNREVNRAVKEDADRLGIFCNVADDPELCSFILPAIHRADPIAVAVSTGGASPALAQRIRSDIATIVTPEHAQLARQLRDLRPWAKRNLPTYEDRRVYFERLVSEALA
jgi:precorrin-2 dehydrogenase / sirohydrochlorin ferrochelatase